MPYTFSLQSVSRSEFTCPDPKQLTVVIYSFVIEQMKIRRVPRTEAIQSSVAFVWYASHAPIAESQLLKISLGVTSTRTLPYHSVSLTDKVKKLCFFARLYPSTRRNRPHQLSAPVVSAGFLQHRRDYSTLKNGNRSTNNALRLRSNLRRSAFVFRTRRPSEPALPLP